MVNGMDQKREKLDSNDTVRQIAERFQCSYKAFAQGSDPKLVEEAYFAAFEAGKAGGFYPVIVCLDDYAVEWLLEISKDYDREQLLTDWEDRGAQILKERYEEYTEHLDEQELADFIGNEKQGDVLGEFCSYCSFRDGTLEADTLLLEIPVKHPWEIIAYVPMGGWNECPAPEEMIPICKYWYEKYGAVPAAFTHDVMEFYAPNGLNGNDPLETAKEHYAFCTDRIDQGTRTYKVSELAAGLAESRIWYFWWD